MLDLNEIRKIFPDWPSELTAAKSASNWRMMAQSFLCAAEVLHEELTSAHKAMHAQVEKKVQVTQIMRQQTYHAAVFCLAFSLELAVKTAWAKLGKLDRMANGKKVPFASHSLCKLARTIDVFDIDSETEKVLNWADSTIRDGKYPVSLNPSDAKSGVRVIRHFGSLLNEVKPVYDKLMAIGSES